MDSITDVKGIKVGHSQDFDGMTGCTVVLCKEGAIGGVDVRGGAPGTRETDLLDPKNLIEKVHAIYLSGGSAFGLDGASGVMRYLEEKNIGFDVGITKVPIVCGAVIFDLDIGDYRKRPDAMMGYEAASNAKTFCELMGSIGAGTGATIGKIRGNEFSMKGGLGTASTMAEDLVVGALVVVNCFGDVMDPDTGEIIAGALDDSKTSFANTIGLMKTHKNQKKTFTNTTIGVVATNGMLTKAQAGKVASMAHNGYARTIRPVHTMYDGDTIFCLSTGKVKADVSTVGVLAAETMSRAIVRAIKAANA